MPPPNRQQILADAIASSVQRQNLLQNGGFEQWHYGIGPFTANNAVSADQWPFALGGTSTVSIVRDAVNVDAGSQYSAAITYVHNAASWYQQGIPSFRSLRGRTISVSVRVRCNTSNP